MWLRTLRGRLTLWNAGVLSVTLLVFGLVLNYTNQQKLSEEINRELLGRARQAARPAPPPGGPPRLPGIQGGPGGQDSASRPNPPANELETFPREAPPPPANDPLAYLRRPQVISPAGKVLMPPRQTRPFDPSAIQVALGGGEAITNSRLGSVPIRVASVPLRRRGGEIIGVVQTARELTDFESLWQGQTATLLLLTPLALLVGGLGALFLVNKALKPVGAATAAAERISGEDLSARLPVTGADEMARLSATFNSMLARLQDSFERQRRAYADLEQSYQSQRRFTGDASHELRTPLARIKLATSSALAKEGLPQDVVESLRIADQSADAMSKIVQELLILSKADAGQLGLILKPVDLRVIAAEAADSFVGRKVGVRLSDAPALICGDEDNLKRVVQNLLQNAARYTSAEKDVSMTVVSDSAFAYLTVKDEGEGIAPEHLPHLGERFYRVDSSRSRTDGGFGLGLSISKSIVEGHRGTIQIASALDVGTSVTVKIPLFVASPQSS